MREPNFLEDGGRSRDRQQWGRGRRWTGQCIGWIDSMIRRAIAKPAKSAVATAALGVIIAAGIHSLRRSGPASAAASIVNPLGTQMQSPSRPAPGAQPNRTKSIDKTPTEAPDNDLLTPLAPDVLARP